MGSTMSQDGLNTTQVSARAVQELMTGALSSECAGRSQTRDNDRRTTILTMNNYANLPPTGLKFNRLRLP